MTLSKKDVFGFFRMGLVDRETVVAWADRALMQKVDYDFTELSLAGSFSYSRMVALLGELSGPASYGTPLNLLFARAGMLLEQNPDRYANIIRGLRLLLAEELRPVEIRSRITSLENDLALLAKSELTPAECMRRLSAFLSPYVEFRGLLGEILP